MREESQNNSTQISQLLIRMYKTEGSKLYFGFTQQHSETIHWIIASDMDIHRELSVFKIAINDSTIPSNDNIDNYLMAIYLGGHKNDVANTSTMPPTLH